MLRPIAFLTILILLSGLSLSVSKAPSCPTVIQKVAPCSGFLTGKSDNPSSACCTGIKGLSSAAQDRADRTVVCECLKQALSKVGSYDANRIPALPQKCGVSISLPPITKNTDCSKA